MKSEKVLLGALAGFATGALVGIFFAPHKGSDLRKKISDQSRDYASDLKEKFSNFVDGLNQKFESAKDEAGNLVDQGKNAVSMEGKGQHQNHNQNQKSQNQKTGASTSVSGAGAY